MRVIVHDYSGHPFQVQLSRALARKGHEVLHLYFSDFQTPHGNLRRLESDASTFCIRGISINEPFRKNSFLKRRAQEIRYGKLVAQAVSEFEPDAVLSANAPLDSQRHIYDSATACGAAFVFWIQDLFGEAITRILSKKIPGLGRLVGLYYTYLENQILQKSNGVVAITADFLPFLKSAGVAVERISVIENWAPLEEMPIEPRSNDWVLANDFENRTNVVYAGTLGFKHNPNVLLALAREVDADVTIFSEGAVVERLGRAAQTQEISNVAVKPWVAFSDLPKMLAAADIVCALMEPDAGIFSVPSKVLSYLAAGRPILAAIPKQNLAARLIEREQAGIVVDPGDEKAFIAAGIKMLSSSDLRKQMSENGRRFAEKNFNIIDIADRFESIISDAIQIQKPQYGGKSFRHRGDVVLAHSVAGE